MRLSERKKFYGIIYCIDGTASFKFTSKGTVMLKKGEILLLSDKSAYTLYACETFKHYTVNFEIHPENSQIDFFKNDYFIFTPENSSAYHQLFKNAIGCRNSKGPAFEIKTTAYIYEIFALLISEIAKKESGSRLYLRLKPARKYIEKNFRFEVTLDMLANLCDMSKTNFRHEWMKLYGESALSYRDKLRISYAKEYLISGYYSVSEVAKMCGFTDTNYFCRFFKKHTSLTAGQYKENFKI